jgi:hypothetical protein
MSVTGMSLAAGADLLNLSAQSAGQVSIEPITSASAAQLRTAVTEAQLSEAFLIGSGGDSTGGQLNVYA